MPVKNMTDEERARFVQDIAEAIHESVPAPLSGDEARWVRMAIKREAQSIAFRQAVIEKTTGALIIAFGIFVGSLFWGVIKEFAANHGWKP